MSCAVPKKGVDPLVIQMMVRFIRDMGLVHFAYRNDREASFNAMIEEACARTGRTGRPVKNDNVDASFPYPVATEDDDAPDTCFWLAISFCTAACDYDGSPRADSPR